MYWNFCLQNGFKSAIKFICAAHNCAQKMWQQAMGSNLLSISITCLSVRLSGYPRAFCDFMSVYMVTRRPFKTRINASWRWTPTLEMNTDKFPGWGSSIPMHIYIYNINIYTNTHIYKNEINVLRLWTPELEMYFYKCSVWGSALRCIYPSVGSSRAYVSVCLYLYLSIYLSGPLRRLLEIILAESWI